MNDKEILAGAPEGATHIEMLASTKVYYLKKDKNGMGYAVFISNEWTTSMAVTGYVRSLADIARIVELEKSLQRQTKKVQLLEPLLVFNEQQRIAELEKERDEYHAMVVYTGGIMEESVGVAGWHLNGDIAEWDELFTEPLYKDALKAHNLEQQAKGIVVFSDVLSETLIEVPLPNKSDARYRDAILNILKVSASKCEEKLVNQANQLRAEAGTIQGGDE